MKNNLGAIRMILEGLLDEKSQHKLSETDMNKYLTMAHHQLVETVKIPERLLKMAQYNENEMTEISVNNAITDITQLMDYNAKRLGIEVNTTLEKNLSVRGSETDFKMIMLNLIQNAIKAMPDGGKLTINGYKKRQRLLIEICDTGIGLMPAS
jgi:signal transduction histidine kinase